jgi:hypothetical protein
VTLSHLEERNSGIWLSKARVRRGVMRRRAELGAIDWALNFQRWVGPYRRLWEEAISDSAGTWE